MGSILLSGTVNFFLSFPPLLFPCFPYTDCAAHLPRCMRIVGRVLRVYPAGLLTIDFDHKYSSGSILGSFDFEI